MGYDDVEYVEIECDEVKAETAMAVLLDLGEEEPKWVPKSLIDGGQDLHEGDCPGTVSIAEWWAEKEGLI